jgi:hypothetical protein
MNCPFEVQASTWDCCLPYKVAFGLVVVVKAGRNLQAYPKVEKSRISQSNRVFEDCGSLSLQQEFNFLCEDAFIQYVSVLGQLILLYKACIVVHRAGMAVNTTNIEHWDEVRI